MSHQTHTHAHPHAHTHTHLYFREVGAGCPSSHTEPTAATQHTGHDIEGSGGGGVEGSEWSLPVYLPTAAALSSIFNPSLRSELKLNMRLRRRPVAAKMLSNHRTKNRHGAESLIPHQFTSWDLFDMSVWKKKHFFCCIHMHVQICPLPGRIELKCDQKPVGTKGDTLCSCFNEEKLLRCLTPFRKTKSAINSCSHSLKFYKMKKKKRKKRGKRKGHMLVSLSFRSGLRKPA